MSVRPKDLQRHRSESSVLHCGECLADYSAAPDDYDWMAADNVIVCAGCGGSALSIKDKTLVDA